MKRKDLIVTPKFLAYGNGVVLGEGARGKGQVILTSRRQFEIWHWN